VVARNCELINRLLERCLNLYSPAVPETVSAPRAADRDQPVVGEFPNDRVWIGRGSPFTDNLSRRTAAGGEDRPQNCADQQSKVTSARAALHYRLRRSGNYFFF